MSNHKSTESALKNLKVQVRQLAKQIANKSSNNFVANTEKNPKEECKAVMTRSKRFVENEEEKSVGLKKKAVEEKGIDGRKKYMLDSIFDVIFVWQGIQGGFMAWSGQAKRHLENLLQRNLWLMV